VCILIEPGGAFTTKDRLCNRCLTSPQRSAFSLVKAVGPENNETQRKLRISIKKPSAAIPEAIVDFIESCYLAELWLETFGFALAVVNTDQASHEIHINIVSEPDSTAIDVSSVHATGMTTPR
jgi:hypothetical protein